jgi:hypothetical protein
MTNYWISKTYEITKFCWIRNIMLVLSAWKLTCNTLPTHTWHSILSFRSPTQCIQNKKLSHKKTTLQSYVTTPSFSLPWAKRQPPNHGLSLHKTWNCTYLRNHNYAGFCEPFFPISDLWICGMTPASRTIISINCFKPTQFITSFLPYNALETQHERSRPLSHHCIH